MLFLVLKREKQWKNNGNNMCEEEEEEENTKQLTMKIPEINKTKNRNHQTFLLLFSVFS